MDLGHPVLPGPVLSGIQEQAGDLEVVDSVEPAETHPLLGVQGIVARVDHPTDSPDNLVTVKDHPHLALAIRQGGHLRERIHLVGMKSRDILRAVLIQFVRELDKTLQVPFTQNLDYFIIRHPANIGI